MLKVVSMRDPVVKVAMRNRDKRYLWCARRWRFLGIPDSRWANPYPISDTDTREMVIAKFREYILARPDLIEALAETVKADGVECLVCWCAPEPCHCDVLVELYEEYAQKEQAV